MSLRVICLVLFVVTVNADLASVKTGLTNLRSSLADRIDKVLSNIGRGVKAVAAVVRSLYNGLGTADKRFRRVEKAQSRIEGSVTIVIKNYTMLKNAFERLKKSLRYRLGCPPKWVRHGWLCYKFYKCLKSCTVNDAKKFCEDQGATLVSLKSAQLNTFVSSLARGRRYYAGARDELVEGEWRWADGSRAVYTNWAEILPRTYVLQLQAKMDSIWQRGVIKYLVGYESFVLKVIDADIADTPNNHWGWEHCLMVLRYRNNTWIDVMCYAKMQIGYVCEK